MNKADLIYGMFIGIAACLLGSFLFITSFTDYNFIDGIQIMRQRGQLGKIITLGAILDLIAFFLLIHYKKELMARGVILALILLTVISIFV